MANSENSVKNDDAKSVGSEAKNSAMTEFLLRAIRLYTYNTPINKGKYRLYQTALKLIKDRPTALPTSTKDGRRLVVDLTTGMQETVFFIGEYEQTITAIAEQMISDGDVCLDVGANFGWYTTIMSLRSGQTGEVHSFEPMPKTFRELQRNREVAAHPDRIQINNFALGDKEDTVQINMFDDLPSGHASLSAKGESRVSSFDCRLTPLDSYLIENGVGDVSFVKVDIEGAEMMFLKGAERLFKQAVPPVFLMEMALAQTKNFGYIPNDLIDFMSERAAYEFYKVEELEGRLVPIEGFASDDIGANVFCVPVNAAPKIKGVVARYLSGK
jgi:methyltransferase, FkbM family